MITNEAVGVPAGIEDVAQEIFGRFTKILIKHASERLPIGDTDFTLGGEYQIGDFSFSKAKIILHLEKGYKGSGLYIRSWGISSPFSGKSSSRKTFPTYDINTYPIHLEVLIPLTESITCENLLDFLTQNHQASISSLSHELKHLYDMIKIGSAPISSISRYASFNPANSFPGLTKFLYFLYYSTHTESLVKNSEVFTRLKLGNITKSGFRDFLKQDSTYIQLRAMRNFSFQTLIKEMSLKDKMSGEALLTQFGVPVPSTPAGVLQALLLLAVESIKSSRISQTQALIGVQPEDIPAFKSGGDKQTYALLVSGLRHEDFLNYLKHERSIDSEFKDASKWIQKQISYMNRQAEILIRKIHKLYSLLPDETN